MIDETPTTQSDGNTSIESSESSPAPSDHRPRRSSTTRSSVTNKKAPTFYAAGFWRRAIAMTIDLALVLPVAFLFCWLAGSLSGIQLPTSRHHGIDFWLDLFLANDPAFLGILGLVLAIASIYLFVFHVTLSKTLGMRLTGLRVINQYGDNVSLPQSMIRTLGYSLCLATMGLGFAWIGFDAERRGLHDWISGTHVVKSKIV